MKHVITVFFPFVCCLAQSQPLTPESLLRDVLANNPELAGEKARVQAEDSAVISQYFLANPRFGLMHESNMTSDQKTMGAMDSWMVSQEILFPTKYVSMGAMQSYRADGARKELEDRQLLIRQKALSSYFNFYAATRNLNLLEAQKVTLTEIARIAEARRATGSVPQQDEMKAHVEQTKIENEILLQNLDIFELKAALNALLNQNSDYPIALPSTELALPKLISSLPLIDKSKLKKSPMIDAKKSMVKEAESARTLARSSYLPDFMLTYRKPTGSNNFDDGYVFNVEMTVPLWFFAKQNSDINVANAKYVAAEKQLEDLQRKVEAEIRSLINKVETLGKLLKIFDTALIPQSTSTLNSSRAAYRAGKVGFQELLDAERSLYSVKIDYNKNLARYVESLTALERAVGESLSNLPFPGEKP